MPCLEAASRALSRAEGWQGLWSGPGETQASLSGRFSLSVAVCVSRLLMLQLSHLRGQSLYPISKALPICSTLARGRLVLGPCQPLPPLPGPTQSHPPVSSSLTSCWSLQLSLQLLLAEDLCLVMSLASSWLQCISSYAFF